MVDTNDKVDEVKSTVEMSDGDNATNNANDKGDEDKTTDKTTVKKRRGDRTTNNANDKGDEDKSTHKKRRKDKAVLANKDAKDKGDVDYEKRREARAKETKELQKKRGTAYYNLEVVEKLQSNIRNFRKVGEQNRRAARKVKVEASKTAKKLGRKQTKYQWRLEDLETEAAVDEYEQALGESNTAAIEAFSSFDTHGNDGASKSDCTSCSES